MPAAEISAHFLAGVYTSFIYIEDLPWLNIISQRAISSII